MMKEAQTLHVQSMTHDICIRPRIEFERVLSRIILHLYRQAFSKSTMIHSMPKVTHGPRELGDRPLLK